MGTLVFVSSLVSFYRKLRKRSLAFKIAILLFTLSQFIAYYNFFRYYRFGLVFNLTTTQTFTNAAPKSASKNVTGNLNLHAWLGICAKDLNALCNFPMYPKAPDVRILLNRTMIDPGESGINVKALRLFGFVTPWTSGLYFFKVKFCSAEIWLGQDETNLRTRRIYSNEDLSQGQKDVGEAELIGGKTYYVEVISICSEETNQLQFLWKTPQHSDFQIINGSFLSYYHKDSNFKHLKLYDDLIPDSPTCAFRRHRGTYFKVYEEISYLSHDEIKDTLPYCEYSPSYVVNHKVSKYHAVTYHVVHTFIYPFPEHSQLQDKKYWIFPLDEKEAFQIVDAFMQSLEQSRPGRFVLKKVRSVERKTDNIKGSRYLIDAELRDLATNNTALLSEYVFMPRGTEKLCYPKDLEWNKTAPVYLVVTAKNLGRWIYHFIRNVERIIKETEDPYLHVIIFDYNSSDIDLEKVLKQSSLQNYKFLRQDGEYSRTRSFTEAINLVSDPKSIVFMVDLHLHIASPLINSIRKHCIKGRMIYTPIIVQMDCGANPKDLSGVWQVYGYGIIGMYKSDWDRAGGYPEQKNTWGGEDWALVDQLFGLGIEFERMRTTHIYHYYHSKKGLW